MKKEVLEKMKRILGDEQLPRLEIEVSLVMRST
jgi:hypothetical protein